MPLKPASAFQTQIRPHILILALWSAFLVNILMANDAGIIISYSNGLKIKINSAELMAMYRKMGFKEQRWPITQISPND